MSRLDDFTEHEIRIKAVCDLASMLASDTLDAHDLPEVLEGLADATKSSHAHVSAAGIAGVLSGSDDPAGDLDTGGYYGVALEVVTPVRKPLGVGVWRSSWAHCYVGYVYGDTYDEAVKAAFDWACKIYPGKD